MTISPKPMAISVCAVLMVLVALVHALMQIDERQSAAQALQVEANNLSQRISDDLRYRIPSLRRMADRWSVRGSTPRTEWEQDAASYVEDTPGYQALEWVDENYIVRWVVPLQGNEPAVDLDLGAEPRRRAALERARAQSVHTATEPVDLVQGGKGFLIYFPIHSSDRFHGFILAVFHIPRFVSSVLTDQSLNDYSIRISYQDEELFASPSPVGTEDLTRSAALRMHDQTWQLELTATPGYVASRASPLPTWFLIGGLVLAVLGGCLTYFWRVAGTHVAGLRDTQNDLRAEIAGHERTSGKLNEVLVELQRDEQQLRSIVESLPLGVGLWDKDDRLVMWNERFEAFHNDIDYIIEKGVTLEEIAREVAPQRVSEGAADSEEAHVRNRLLARANPGADLVRRLQNGSIFVIKDNPVATGGTLETFSDVTTERLASEALEARETLLRGLLAAMRDGVAYFDDEDRLVRWNQAYLDAFPELRKLVHTYPSYEQCLRAVLAASGVEDIDAAVAERVAARQGDQANKYRQVTNASGRNYLVLESRDLLGGSVLTFTDVSDLHAREMELLRSNEELEQFAYVASHDLQEPLRMVASYTQLLAEKYEDQLDEDARVFIEYAADGAARMQSLVADLLQYSRAGRPDSTLERVSLNAVMDQVAHRLGRALEEHNVLIKIGELPVIEGYPSALTRLFQNLLENAVKFRGQTQPEIQVSARRSGASWEIRVADNGIGIKPEFSARIFEPFKRLHHRDAIPGNGIGLALCLKIARQHGGGIRVHSVPGEGSTFVVTLAEQFPDTGEPAQRAVAS